MSGNDTIRSNGYSPFWPIAMVFLALMIGYSIQLWGLVAQYRQLKSSETSLTAVMPQVQVINGTLQNVSQNLLDLSTTDPVAKQLVNEFNIRSNAGRTDK